MKTVALKDPNTGLFSMMQLTGFGSISADDRSLYGTRVSLGNVKTSLDLQGIRVASLETADTAKTSQISSLENDWAKLSVNFAGTPAFNATIGSGDVYTYTYTNPSRTLYRLVGTSTDQFYTGFDGSALSGLVCTRGG